MNMQSREGLLQASSNFDEYGIARGAQFAFRPYLAILWIVKCDKSEMRIIVYHRSMEQVNGGDGRAIQSKEKNSDQFALLSSKNVAC